MYSALFAACNRLWRRRGVGRGTPPPRCPPRGQTRVLFAEGTHPFFHLPVSLSCFVRFRDGQEAQSALLAKDILWNCLTRIYQHVPCSRGFQQTPTAPWPGHTRLSCCTICICVKDYDLRLSCFFTGGLATTTSTINCNQ